MFIFLLHLIRIYRTFVFSDVNLEHFFFNIEAHSQISILVLQYLAPNFNAIT